MTGPLLCSCDSCEVITSTGPSIIIEPSVYNTSALPANLFPDVAPEKLGFAANGTHSCR